MFIPASEAVLKAIAATKQFPDETAFSVLATKLQRHADRIVFEGVVMLEKARAAAARTKTLPLPQLPPQDDRKICPLSFRGLSINKGMMKHLVALKDFHLRAGELKSFMDDHKKEFEVQDLQISFSLSDAFGLGEGEIPSAVQDLAFILEQLRDGKGLIGQAIQDPSLSRQVLTTLDDVEQASQSLVLASQAIQEAGTAISGASADLSTGSVAVGNGAQAIESGMPAIQEGAESIDTAMEEINRTLKELNRSLTRMQQVIEQLPGARVLGKDQKDLKGKAAPGDP